MHIIVGGLIEKGGKYLLVQEAKEKCYGKWNLPAGRLDANETLMAGAEREIKEECGCDVEVTGVCQIGNQKSKGDNLVSIIFTTKLISDEIKFDKNEILDVGWFSYDEIMSMRDELRSERLIIGAIDNTKNGIVAPMKIVELGI